MNLSRLMVLGLLATHGPRHGHQIRRDAEGTNVSSWGGVNVGALYRELRRMEEEGLVEPVRTEQVGRRPARTVYRITGEGQRELSILREQAIRDLHPAPDVISVALLFGRVWDRGELVEWLQARRRLIASILEGIAAKRDHLQAKGFLTPLDVAVFRRAELRLEAELHWHDEFDIVLAELPDPARHAGSKRKRKKKG
jgi:DNA-binding PadR family transcriptional regulator